MAENAAQLEQMNKAVLGKAGKYLTFALGKEQYGLEILKVREIIGYMEITAVPQTPHYVKGVINLRGQVIPVIDLRARFNMELAEITEESCVIVVEIQQNDRKFSTGLAVDRVEEVLDILEEDIEESPQFGSSVNTDFILGMGKVGDSVKILLDIDKVLTTDISSFGGVANNQPDSRQEAHTEQAKAPEETEAPEQTEQEQQEQPQDEQEQPQDDNADNNHQ